MKHWHFLAAGTLLAGLVAVVLTILPRTPATQVNQTAEYTVRLGVDADGVGERIVTVELTPTSATSAAIDRVAIVPTMPLDGMATPSVTAQPTAPGRYVAAGVQCSMAGVWDLAVRIGAGGKEETTHFTVTMR